MYLSAALWILVFLPITLPILNLTLKILQYNSTQGVLAFKFPISILTRTQDFATRPLNLRKPSKFSKIDFFLNANFNQRSMFPVYLLSILNIFFTETIFFWPKIGHRIGCNYRMVACWQNLRLVHNSTIFWLKMLIKSPSKGPKQQIKPHSTRWHYPLITYLTPKVKFTLSCLPWTCYDICFACRTLKIWGMGVQHQSWLFVFLVSLPTE